MLGYPTTGQALRDLTRTELGKTPLCRAVARKAQARGQVARDLLSLTGTILGTISHRNDPEGLSVDYTTTPQLFPDGSDRMNFYADLTGISEARLIANIRSGGGSGTILTVNGAGEDIAVGLQVITSSPEIVVGSWHPITSSAGGATLLTWSIEGSGAGTVILGLCQLIGR